MKKIFFITNELSGGGAERVMSVVANYLDDKKYEVHFLILKKSQSEYPMNETVIKHQWDSQKSGDVIGQIKYIRGFMKSNPGATFVSFFTHQNLYTILASFGMKVKVVVSERNDPEYSIHGKIKKIARKILYASSMCDEIIFQTKGASEYFPDKIRRKGVIIPNPLKDGLPQPYTGERRKEVVSFGRFEPQKNYRMLIDAFSMFVEKFPDYKLTLYGKGSLESELKEQIKKLNIEDKVEFAGFCKDVHERIVDAAMFVLPSDYEGLSNSMLEAMAIGLPVICTDSPPGGASEYIDNGVNGLLVPVGDACATSTAMEKMAAEPQNAASMGARASQVKELLNTEVICRLWEKELA